jgi:hypothetical protein
MSTKTNPIQIRANGNAAEDLLKLEAIWNIAEESKETGERKSFPEECEKVACISKDLAV